MTDKELGEIRRRLRDGSTFIEGHPTMRELLDDIAALLAGYKELEAEVKRLKGDSDMIVALLECELGKPYLELTAKLKEHPEDYDRSCLCELCRSDG